ncbi:hypothetical protein L3V83_02320 [Thiotrichales bacterium 19X7-9]|nr:hypothetical protein [Thiotrichales bacterium 19X7-9]
MITTNAIKTPMPLFDDKKHFLENFNKLDAPIHVKEITDFYHAKNFLKLNSNSDGTFNSYRREVERLLHWSWLIQNKSLKELSLEDMINYIDFCKKPPQSWIDTKKSRRFIFVNNKRVPNSNWKPFVSTLSRQEYKTGKKASIEQFKIKESSINEIILILSSFFNYLLQKAYIDKNPIVILRHRLQKQHPTKKCNLKKQSQFNQYYIQQLISSANLMAKDTSFQSERSHFIIYLLAYMKIKPSELIPTNGITPKMSDIYKINNTWYIKTNSNRHIPFEKNSLDALIRWRKYLCLSNYPQVDEDTPLLPKQRGFSAINTQTHLRRIIIEVFENTSKRLKQEAKHEDAIFFENAKVSWISK